MNEIEKVQQNLPAEANQPNQVTNNIYAASGSTTIATNHGPVGVDQETVNKIFGGIEAIMGMMGGTPPQQNMSQTQSHAMEWASLSKERYCLFVLENEKYNTGSFCIPNKKVLKYTDDFTRDNLVRLTSADVEMIKTMPCIFAMRNKHFKKAEEGFPFMVGRITEIEVQAENIKFSFTVFPPAHEQGLLNGNIKKLGLKETTCRNQLDEEHWAVVNGNLFDIGKEIGIKVD